MGRFSSATGCTSVTSDEIWVGSVVYVAPYPLPSKRAVIFAQKSLCINFHGTEVGKLTGHLVPTFAAFSFLKRPWDFHSFLKGFVSSPRTEGVEEEFTVTSLISLSRFFFFSPPSLFGSGYPLCLAFILWQVPVAWKVHRVLLKQQW